MKTLTIKTLTLAGMLLMHLALGSAQAAEATILQLANPPQSNGIEIGDILKRTVTIELAQPYQISKNAFPQKGASADGIELVDIHSDSAEHGKKTVYTIALSYQVFAYAGSPKVMQLPKQSFAVTGGPKAISLSIPAWGFWYSPLVANVGINAAKANLQPSQPPLLIALRGHRIRLLAFAGLVVIGFIGLIYVNADRKWLPFMGGPFARAYRRIKRLPQNPAQEKQALFYLHEAFNQTFGATLFARNVQQFVARHPAFSRLQADIQAFFEKSNKALFADDSGNAAAMNDLLALSKNLRNSERGV